LIPQANPILGSRERWRAAPALSLRARLLLLVVASVMPLLAFSLVSQYLQYRQAVAATGQQTLELARSMTLPGATARRRRAARRPDCGRPTRSRAP
jgi:hypothetical protein